MTSDGRVILVANSLCSGQEQDTMCETEDQIGYRELDTEQLIFGPRPPRPGDDES